LRDQDRGSIRHRPLRALWWWGIVRRGWIRSGGVLLGMVLLAVFLLRPAPASQPGRAAIGPDVGERAPSLRLPDLRGRRWSLAAWHGHTVVLLFLATWCEGCREELPGLMRSVPMLQARGLQLVGVDAVGGEPGTVSHFARAYGIRFPVLLDTSTATMAAFAVQALPTSVVIGAGGRILAHHEAPVDAGMLLKDMASGQ